MATSFNLSTYETQKQTLDNIREFRKTFLTQSKWTIFPFYCSNGAIDITNNSYKSLNYRINDASSFERIFLGNESILYVWKNSTKLTIEKQGDEFHTKEYKVGSLINANEVSRNYNLTFGNTKSWTTESTNEIHTMMIMGEKFNISDEYNVYVIKNNTNQSISNANVDNQDNQLFYISNLTNIYSFTNNKDAIAQVITFSSLNERLQSSGQTEQQSILFSASGSGYAFPFRDDNNKWILNKTYLTNVGTKAVNFNSFGPSALMGIKFYGYPILQNSLPIISEDGTTAKDKVYNIRPLNFAWDGKNWDNTEAPNKKGILIGLANKLYSQKNLKPESLMGYIQGKTTGYTNITNWLTYLKEKFNFLTQNQFYGILDCSSTPLDEINDKLVFYDDDLNFTRVANTLNVNNNSYFVLPNDKAPNSPFYNSDGLENNGTDNFNNIFLKANTSTFQDIVNVNSYFYHNILQVILQSDRVINFGSVIWPALGKFLNYLDLGIPFPLHFQKKTADLPQMVEICAFMSGIYAKIGNLLFGTSGNLLSLDQFTSDDTVGKITGASVSSQSYMLTLTDKIKTKLVLADSNGVYFIVKW